MVGIVSGRTVSNDDDDDDEPTNVSVQVRCS